jgi:integrase
MPRKPEFGRIYRRKKRLRDGRVVELRTWTIEYYDASGKQVRESSKSTKYKKAQDLLRTRLVELDNGTYIGPRAERVTVGDLLDELLADYEDNNKSINWARMVVEKHLRPFFGTKPASAITTPRLRDYIGHRRQERPTIANGTLNRELALLRRALYIGYEQTPPKVKRVPKFPRLTESAARQGFFERAEFEKHRAELPEYLRPVSTFAYWTGCRRGEVLGLQWPQVDLIHKVVRLEPGATKNDEARIIPLWGELYDMLVRLKQLRDQRWPNCPWVFCRAGQRIRSLKNAWAEACKRAGLADEDEKPTRLFHDLRRTGVRNLVRAGVPERVAMAISGHRTRSVFDRYNIVSERDLHDAAKRMELHQAELDKAARERAKREKERGKDTLRTPGRNSGKSRETVDRKLLN